MADERLSAERLAEIELRRGLTVADLTSEIRASWAELETAREVLRDVIRAADIGGSPFERAAAVTAARALVGSVPQPLADKAE